MEAEDKDRDARALEQYKEELENQLQNIVREFQGRHPGPVEMDLSFVEGEGSGPAPDELKPRVRTIVEAFHRKPLVSRSGVRVHKVTAIDSDEDGQVAVRVLYDYPGYAASIDEPIF